MKKSLFIVIVVIVISGIYLNVSYSGISENQAFNEASRLETIEAYSEFLKQYPSGEYSDKTLKRLSQLYLENGAKFLVENNLAAAFKEFEQIVRIDSNNVSGLVAEAYNNMGILSDKQANGLSREAINYYQKAIKIDARLVAAYINLGGSYANFGIENKDIASFNHALVALNSAKKLSERITPDEERALKKEMVRTHVNLGILYVEIDDSQNAVKEFNEVLIIEPQNPTANANLGFEYTKSRQYEKAIYHTKKAIEYDESEDRKEIMRNFYQNYLLRYSENPHLDPGGSNQE
jgi:tetratricopeptide (TPR) repeat protein